MTNETTIQRVVRIYRPLYLLGLLRDGQYRLPATAAKPGMAKPRRMLLAALTGLRHGMVPTRNRP